MRRTPTSVPDILLGTIAVKEGVVEDGGVLQYLDNGEDLCRWRGKPGVKTAPCAIGG